jgi:hypothetical protein
MTRSLFASGNLFITATLFFGSSVYAQHSNVLPSYQVRHTHASITIDGKLEPREWGQASPAFDQIFPWSQQTGAKQKTRVKLLWDEKYLYVAYQNEDTDLTAQVRKRDEFVYRDDTVEIFLNVKPSQSRAYYCLEMNALSTIMDYICIDGNYYMRQFDFHGVKVGIAINGTVNLRGDQDHGWNAELAIPWDNFDEMASPPKIGDVYTANFNRWDGVDPNRRLSVWSDSGLDWPHPHVPARFGTLVLTNSLERTVNELSSRFHRQR